MNESRPLARTEGLLTEEIDGELLVYDLAGDIAVHLNKTAALVWRNCDGRRTIAELLTLVRAELAEAANEDVVLMALDSLSERGLISSGYEERDGAAVALSRRRFFRRVGVVGAAAVNAPVVYSAIVPLAAAAQSSGGPPPNNNSGFIHQGGGGFGGGSGGGSGQGSGEGSGGGSYP